MARHIAKRDNSSATGPLEQNAPAVRGGASGEPTPGPQDPNLSSHHIHGISDVTPARRRAPEEPPRRFKVVGGPHGANGEFSVQGRTQVPVYRVVYEGAITRVMHGREYVEHSVDLDKLRSQGILLEEIDPKPQQAAETSAAE